MLAKQTRQISLVDVRRLVFAAALIVCLVPPGVLYAGETTSRISISHPPRIVIVIDDIGNQLSTGRQAIALSRNGPITFAVIPFTPYGKELAELAHRENNEVILHMPMEPVGEHKLHPGMLTRTMSQSEFISNVRKSIEELPFISGINNHMGSLLTQHGKQMHWLMDELRLNTSLFFLDSLTSEKSVAYTTARTSGVPAFKRDIFLDSEQSDAFVERQFTKLQRLAAEQGYAVGIGHPYPETLRVLNKRLPELAHQGYELVSLRQILSSPTNLPYRHAASGGGNSPSETALSLKDRPIFNHQAEHPVERAK